MTLCTVPSLVVLMQLLVNLQGASLSTPILHTHTVYLSNLNSPELWPRAQSSICPADPRSWWKWGYILFLQAPPLFFPFGYLFPPSSWTMRWLLWSLDHNWPWRVLLSGLAGHLHPHYQSWSDKAMTRVVVSLASAVFHLSLKTQPPCLEGSLPED
jgi:hypothetical protein